MAKFIAIILLILAVFDQPYGFYKALRWVVFLVAMFEMVKFFALRRPVIGMMFGFVAAVFNPVLIFHFDKSVWRVIDLLTAFFMIATFVIERDKINYC